MAEIALPTTQTRRLIRGGHVYGPGGCTSLSRTSVWRAVRNGTFPPPVSVSAGRVAWFADEIEAWLAVLKPKGAPSAVAS